ncbi:transcriptional regulator, LacI family [Emticicia oligotrophica DSM 17448]|uniref:Transcriptional regulator, LacI family n=1 Tax=Emticicia oligotrophica (strain DSM 17448 / CIP 109782 / MTCC 6937 / GPTSA100-15) TaxID=929562 RepID=A0ABN4AJB6_EMTOG|nr:LacI family DNA-binding transcriptional regulator [Emticicia oligotrophica]AFK02248.1 transcriptional regulator, LacI family [Emticicia oligotrophica DSM 17448]
MEAVTIKDIAKALNLSTSTVSRALRGSYEINAETKKMVLEYADKVNYSPNPIALSLKENKSRTIGVIVPEIANNFFSQAINGIEDVANKRGYHVVIFQSHESYEREIKNVQHIIARKVDGLLISLSGQTENVSHLLDIQAKKLPLVLFDRVSEKIEAHKVVADNFDGAFKATEHLILSGRRRIAHVTSPSLLSISQERLMGYKTALEKYQIPYDESFVKYCGFEPEEAQKLIFNLIENQKPDAIFTTSDRLALDCFSALKELGISVPDKLSFIGFTNLKVAHLLAPSLSTIVQPAFEIGQTAAELLVDLIEKKQRNAEHLKTIKIPTEMVIRKSSDLS